MDVVIIREYCLSKEHVTEGLPFDQDTLVMKVSGKMFALFNIENFESVNLKCDPEKAVELREKYTEIIPGYHMNKKHWNTVYVNKGVNDTTVFELIDHSYDLVMRSLPKNRR